MKNPLFLLTIALVFFSCTNKKNSLYEYDLKGPVVKVYESSYDAVLKFGKWETGDKDFSGNQILFFSEDGNLTEIHQLDDENDLMGKTFRKYENGILIETLVYDNNGDLQEKRTNKSKNGKVVESDYYGRDGAHMQKTLFGYDGSRIKSGEVRRDGKMEMRWENNFKGKNIEIQTQYDSTGNISKILKFEYNGNGDVGKLISSDKVDQHESKIEWSYEYDNKNNWIKRVQNVDGEVESIVIRKILYRKDLNRNFSESDLVGIWVNYGDEEWIEFKKDGTFEFGSEDEIEDNGKWEMDKTNSTITLRPQSPDHSKKYNYRKDDFFLVFSTIGSKEEYLFEKK